MFLKKDFFLISALCASAVFYAHGQTTITGTVKSSTGGGVVAGASVSLKLLGISGQSGADGKFSMTVTTSARQSAHYREQIKPEMDGSILRFGVTDYNGKASVDVFDLNGVCRVVLSTVCSLPGMYEVEGLAANLPAGFYVVRLSVEGVRSSFPLPVLGRGAASETRIRPAAASPLSLAKKSAVIDSLVAQKTGYVRSATPVSQYSGDYTIVLDSVAESASSDVAGKVVVGYQGWFACRGDGSPLNNWNHTNLEMWPDCREYPTTFSGCPFNQAGAQQPGYTGNLGNGQPARIFSEYTQSTTNVHVQWMQQYGIDCAAIQRFGTELGNRTLKAYRDSTSVHLKNSCETYGRKFYIMYDISGWGSFQNDIKTDWTNTIVGSLHLTTSTGYAKQGGKPVVCIWGFGVSGEPGNASSWTDVITWFKNQGCYVIGGTAGGFANDASNSTAYNACNMLMPWPVGATGSMSSFQSTYSRDLTYCNAHGIDYQAGCYPGTSFYNSNNSWPKNKIPRMHGDFMWSQFAGMRNAGVKSMYIAMFDEMQEATSVFKIAEDSTMVPKGYYFVNLDADGVHVSSDFYLRLITNGARMMKGLIPYQATHTTPFVQ